MISSEIEFVAGYSRGFSAICGLQQAHRVEYALYRTPQGLQIKVQAHGGAWSTAQCALPGAAEPLARGILQFLYENAIPAEHICDIVSELYPAV